VDRALDSWQLYQALSNLQWYAKLLKNMALHMYTTFSFIMLMNNVQYSKN